MLKTLLQKQFQSIGYSLFHRSGYGKMKKKGAGAALYILLMVYLVGVFAFLFFGMMTMLCEPLMEVGLTWLYFAYGAIMATALAVFGSVFAAQAQLYDAKDNELLLSLPIPPRSILLCRMLPLYIQNLVFEAVVLLPCYVVYAMHAGVSAAAIVCQLMMLVLLPLFSLTLCCVLGWLIALLTARMRRKNLMTIILSIAFLAVYFTVYSQINRYLQLLLANSAALSGAVKSYFWLFYECGLGSMGGIVPTLIVSAIFLALFGALYAALSASYIRIVTTKRGAKKARYEERALHAGSADAALLKKEFRRFTGSPIYLMNCGLGTLFLIAGAVLAVFKGADFVARLAPMAPYFGPLAAAAICSVCSMNTVTAPSVSLEGRSLWILQSSPLDPRQILRAKLRLHLLVSAPAALLCALALCFILELSAPMKVLVVMLPQAFLLFTGYFGLFLNLKRPNFHWDNETVVVKQSMAVGVTIFGGWGLLIALAGGFFAVRRFLNAEQYMGLCMAVLVILDLLLSRWVNGKGARILESL